MTRAHLATAALAVGVLLAVAVLLLVMVVRP